MAKDEWEKAETMFRLTAFHVYYRNSEEQHKTLRFANALLASARPIRQQWKRDLIISWWKKHKSRWIKNKVMADMVLPNLLRKPDDLGQDSK